MTGKLLRRKVAVMTSIKRGLGFALKELEVSADDRASITRLLGQADSRLEILQEKRNAEKRAKQKMKSSGKAKKSRRRNSKSVRVISGGLPSLGKRR